MVENKKTATAKPWDVMTSVTATLRKFADKGELVLPEDYSIENALKSAWLVLQETENKDKIPVLQSCSQASIANALLDMAVQGLNPAKKQCYFIAYGKKLLCQRSYFGTMAVAERVAKAKDIWAEIVYDGDEFSYEITHNRKNVTKHTQKLENIGPNIIAAYCVIEFGNGKPDYTEIMTIEQIHKSWEKSRMKGTVSTHTEFPDEMAKRTVISRACKKFINASSDSNLFLEHFNRTDEERAQDDVDKEIAGNANKNILEIETELEVTEEQPVEELDDTETRDYRIRPQDAKSLKPMPKTIDQLMKDCKDDFSMDDKQVCAELGVSSRDEITEIPADCYVRIRATHGTEPGEGPPF